MARRIVAVPAILLILSSFPLASCSWLSKLITPSTKTDSPLSPSTDSAAAAATKNEAFLTWFTSNGGYINPAITLTIFQVYGNGLSVLPSHNIRHMDTLFSAPPSIILSPSTIATQYPPSIASELQRVKNDNYAIAMQLCAECYLKSASRFHPYLQVLPSSVSNLEMFTLKELAMLESNEMYDLGKQIQVTTNKQYEAVSSTLSSMASHMATKQGVKDVDEGCLTLESFRHYTSVVGSRAMVMSGRKYLTPLADMPNYEPKEDGREEGNGQDFLKYHVLGEDGSMTVKSDRDFAEEQQVFEDYGDNPNSLYLEVSALPPLELPKYEFLSSLPFSMPAALRLTASCLSRTRSTALTSPTPWSQTRR